MATTDILARVIEEKSSQLSRADARIKELELSLRESLEAKKSNEEYHDIERRWREETDRASRACRRSAMLETKVKELAGKNEDLTKENNDQAEQIRRLSLGGKNVICLTCPESQLGTLQEQLSEITHLREMLGNRQEQLDRAIAALRIVKNEKDKVVEEKAALQERLTIIEPKAKQFDALEAMRNKERVERESMGTARR